MGVTRKFVVQALIYPVTRTGYRENFEIEISLTMSIYMIMETRQMKQTSILLGHRTKEKFAN